MKHNMFKHQPLLTFTQITDRR